MAVLTWLEHRKSHRFKGVRTIAQALAVLALLGLMLRPSRDVQKAKPGLIVLTDGFSKLTLDSLLRTSADLKVVRIGNHAGKEQPVDTLASWRQLDQVGQVRFVLGEGIPVSFLDNIQGAFQYFPGKMPEGIVALDLATFPEQRRNWLTGSVRGRKGARIALSGPGGVEDSLTVETDALSPFRLRFTTKVAGRYIYQLSLTDKEGNTTVEEVPVEVAGSRMLRVLLLQAFPTAEVRFLKSYLTAKGHKLVTRYLVSRNMYRYEVANEAVRPEGALDAKALENFDLVIADNPSFQQTGATELRAIERAVNGGLGVLMLLNGIPETKAFPGTMLQLTPVAPAPDTIRYSVGSFGSFALPFVPVKAGPGIQAMAHSSGMLLQGLVLSGDGKVAVQTLRETYRLALHGDNGAYAALWTPLLEQSARREEVNAKFKVTTEFPVYPDEPVDVEIVGNGPLQLTTAEGALVPLSEDLSADELWRGTVWSSQTGWNVLQGEEFSGSYFVSRPGAWASIRAEVQRAANAMRSGKPGEAQTTLHREEVSPIYFFLLFLVSAGFLWLAPKL